MHGPQWRYNSVSAYFCAYAYFHIFLFVFFGVFVDFVYVCLLVVRSRLHCWGGRLTSVAAQFLFVFSLYLCAFLICFPISVFWCVCVFCVDFVLFVRSRLLWLLWPTDLSGGQNQTGSLLKINLPKNQHFSKSNIG